MITRAHPLLHRRASFVLIAANFFALTFAANAVILFRTGDPGANTNAPTGDLAGSGWQYQGTFGNYLGTTIAPHFFITAKHIGGAPKFFFRGINYTVLRSYDVPSSDLAVWEVAETFPAYAPLYSGGDEVGKRLVVIGRGTRRGPERVVNGLLRGWEWSTSDHVQRWGENQVASVKPGGAGGDLLYALFDQAALPHEAHLSAGDSGGAVFLNDGGVWKLAGINYDVDTFTSGPDAGGPYNSAMFDQRGSYTANGSLVTGNAPVPSGFYASRISSSFSWISNIIAPRLANISSRAAVGQGDQVSIAGFVIEGASNQPRRVIIRGIGPSLPVTGRMADPVLTLHDATGTAISSNDNWRGSQTTEIQQSGLAPADESDAVIIATLPSGSYTAILRGANGSTGVGLIEVYDLDSATGSRLINLSTRAHVRLGDEVLIGGLIPRGISARVLLRALGPTLSGFGLTGVMVNPTLALHDANGALLTFNDDWKNASNRSDITATGFAPSHDREAAILIAAPLAESYTAIVRGVGNSTGIALLEAYLIP